MPMEQARWNQSNIDTLFYAGNQSFVNRQFNFSPSVTSQQYYFNLVQQPVNMVTGYQRQHRKSIVYQAIDGADPQTTDQYTKLITNVCQKEGIHEQFSKGCELSAIAAKCLLQPYLDYSSDDPAQGVLKVKIWEYNSFLIDPYYRDMQNMSDCQFVWCQEYISKKQAESIFPDRMQQIRPMSASPQRYGNFYFLPENHNMARNDLMIISYVWYKWVKKKKRLYSRKLNQFFDYAGGDGQLEQILYAIDDMEEVTVEVPCWKLATVLNDQLMYQGENPLGDMGCPFVSVDWNYEPHINHYDLRCRSLIYTMRSPQFLFNYKVITNNDITAATINAGWKRKIGAVANEDNLKKSGQGWDVIINEGYELADCEKIIPSGVPESDMALAEQMASLIFKTSGIDLENWSGQNDKQISALTLLMKQAANLMVFQKYFDQWDQSLKQLGEKMLQIVLNNWSAEKVGMMIGEEPSPHFYSKIFAKYHTVVQEGLLTATQKNLQAQQMLEINERFGREVLPASMIIKDMNIQGKAEIMEFLQSQEEQAAHKQAEMEDVQHAFESAKLQEMYSKATANIARAREDHSRSESNLGLYQERVSMIQRNEALTMKEKQAAMTSLLENIQKFGEIETAYAENKLNIDKYDIRAQEEIEKQDVERRSESNKFVEQILGQAGQIQAQASMGVGGQEQQQNPSQNMQ